MIYMTNKRTGQRRKVESGFSWKALLLNFIYYAYKGMWGKAILYFFLIVLTGWTFIIPLAIWIYCASKFNEEYRDYLFNEGYSFE